MENDAYRELKQRIKDGQNPLAYAIGLMNDQRNREIEAARKEVENCLTPFDKEAFKFLSKFPAQELDVILIAHPGYNLWKSISSYKVILNVLETSRIDLMAEIESYGTNQRIEFLEKQQLDFHTNAVRKEFFAFTAVAQSLVDYTRIVQRHAQIQDYKDKLNLIFNDVGLHELIVEIRNIFLHGKPIVPNWFWTRDLLTGKNKFGFSLEKKVLGFVLQNQRKRIGEEKLQKIMNYLGKHIETKLDLVSTLKSYSTMVASFHKWYIESLRIHNPSSWLDCEKCIHKSNRNTKVQMMKVFSKRE
jgi:hypothetical protein